MKKILSCTIVALLLTVSSVSAKDSFFKGSRLKNVSYRVPAEVGQFVSSDASFQKVPPAPGTQKKALKAQTKSLELVPLAEGHNHAHGNPCCNPCIRYKDLHNIHPCAVKKIVSIVDPCWDHHSCCPPKCIQVAICVPPCGCVRVKVSRHGHKVKYDYGKYEIEIYSRNGKITVDYDD